MTPDTLNLLLGIGATATALQVIILIFQCFLLYRTLNISRNSLILVQRAYIYLQDFEVGREHQFGPNSKITHFTITPRWRNGGATPPANMRVNVNWGYYSGDLPGDFSYSFNKPMKPMMIGPQDTEYSETLTIPVGETAEEIYIWGHVDYEDIFDHSPSHFTYWCYRLEDRIDGRFVAYGPHNRAGNKPKASARKNVRR